MKWVIVNCALLVGIESLLADGISGNATGFFHVEKIDGRDWAIAPDGRPTPATLSSCRSRRGSL